MKISIIIPCYNESRTIANVISELEKVSFERWNLTKEVIVVDDGSRDNTWQILEAEAKRHPLVILRHQKNRGKGAAIRTALESATGDYVVIQDADLEYVPQDLTLLAAALVERNAEVVYGSRFLEQDHPERMQTIFFLGNRVLAGLANVLYGLNLTDEATCYKSFRKKTLDRIRLVCDHFEFCPEVTAKLALLDIPILEVPIRYQGRTAEEGKKITWRDGVTAIRTLLKYWWAHKVLRRSIQGWLR